MNVEEKVKFCFAKIIKIDPEQVDMSANLFEVYAIDSMGPLS